MKQFIQSNQAQEISDYVIHYQKMMMQYNFFINQEVDGVLIDDEEIRRLFAANKLFLDCSKDEAIDQYGLVGYDSITRKPVTKGGLTKKYVIAQKEGEFDNCIPIPEEGMDAFDFTGYEYQIVEVEIEETTE